MSLPLYQLPISIYEINDYRVNGEQRFSKKQVRKLLGIDQRSTLTKNVKCLKQAGLNFNRSHTWKDVYELLALRLYINIKHGDTTTFTRQIYAVIRTGGIENVKTVLSDFGIDLDQRFKEIKRDFKGNKFSC